MALRRVRRRAPAGRMPGGGRPEDAGQQPARVQDGDASSRNSGDHAEGHGRSAAGRRLHANRSWPTSLVVSSQSFQHRQDHHVGDRVGDRHQPGEQRCCRVASSTDDQEVHDSRPTARSRSMPASSRPRTVEGAPARAHPPSCPASAGRPGQRIRRQIEHIRRRRERCDVKDLVARLPGRRRRALEHRRHAVHHHSAAAHRRAAHHGPRSSAPGSADVTSRRCCATESAGRAAHFRDHRYPATCPPTPSLKLHRC